MVSGQQRPGLDTGNTPEQKNIWLYLLKHKMAMRPRHVLSEANARIDENFIPQNIASLGRLPDNFWNEHTKINTGHGGALTFADGRQIFSFDNPVIFRTKKGYTDYWMENGVWYGQLPDGLAEDITAEVTPQITRFMNENMHLFPDPVQQAKIPTGANDNCHTPFRHKPGAIWVSPQDFGDVFEAQEPDIKAALRYEMIRGTDVMKQLAQRLKKPDTKEQDISNIIRGVKAFDLHKIDGGDREIATPEQFRVPQGAYWDWD